MSSAITSVGNHDEVGQTNDEKLANEHEEDGETVLQRHRKEKKELQAKITSMKHSVSKSDKSKKKEMANEIARLEAELADRHSCELKELNGKLAKNQDSVMHNSNAPELQNNEQDGEENGQDVSPDQSKKKPTKAQKRREKKDTKAKETERAIAESIQEAKQGIRYKEQQLFKTVLASKGLSFHHVSADGDCLYNAVAHQLSLNGMPVQMSELRRCVASVMASNRDDYLPFLTNHDGDALTEEEFEDYCAKLLKPGVWGGHPELVALSTHFQRPIEVLQADAAPILIGEQYANRAKPLVITYHRHAFRLGEHYNSTAPVTERNEDDDANDDV